ncbi:MAG: hypothetical protein HQ495_07830 [Alphaproteobacteria bacterium]|nr:hypothetical protein [Alphaproteobacteria bacterium]
MSGVKQWRKLGLVFRPDQSKYWMRSHAAAPTPLHLGNDHYRVFFAGRDARQRSHVGFFEMDLSRPDRVDHVSAEPVLAPGPVGTFDGDGIYATSVTEIAGRVFLYTLGWNRGDPAPLFYAAAGLAISEDGGRTFEKLGRAPIMARSEHDPTLVTAPVVLRRGRDWYMWYVSGQDWFEDDQGALRSRYHIKLARSDDGIDWRRDGTVCIAGTSDAESNIGRCWVVDRGDEFEAWYSVSGGAGYRIGFARSHDGANWVRHDDKAGIACSAQGWDSESISYPAVVRYAGAEYMFYNGNGFGRDGIGIAVRDGTTG